MVLKFKAEVLINVEPSFDIIPWLLHDYSGMEIERMEYYDNIEKHKCKILKEIKTVYKKVLTEEQMTKVVVALKSGSYVSINIKVFETKEEKSKKQKFKTVSKKIIEGWTTRTEQIYEISCLCSEEDHDNCAGSERCAETDRAESWCHGSSESNFQKCRFIKKTFWIQERIE